MRCVIGRRSHSVESGYWCSSRAEWERLMVRTNSRLVGAEPHRKHCHDVRRHDTNIHELLCPVTIHMERASIASGTRKRASAGVSRLPRVILVRLGPLQSLPSSHPFRGRLSQRAPVHVRGLTLMTADNLVEKTLRLEKRKTSSYLVLTSRPASGCLAAFALHPHATKL